MHWVLRNSDLRPCVELLKQAFGMRVLRHEENAEPCAITCNGRYNNAWSKTMIGYDTEDKGYCLEVTFNYGVYEYTKGTGLTEIAIGVEDPANSLARAQALGFKVNGATIEGLDGYNFTVAKKERDEPFLHVCLNVSDVEKAKTFYIDILGMVDLTDKAASVTTVAFSTTQVALRLTQAAEVRIEETEGRHAIAMPEQRVREVYAKIEAAHPELIVHPFRELHEKLGTLVIAIIKDFDGFEICLVSSETFDKAAKEACDWKDPDWDHRRSFLDERAPKSKKGTSS